MEIKLLSHRRLRKLRLNPRTAQALYLQLVVKYHDAGYELERAEHQAWKEIRYRYTKPKKRCYPCR